MTVFMSDAQQRKTLVCLRSLGRRGVRVIAGEDTRWALSRFSRYCSRGVVYPHPGKEKERFYAWLRDYLAGHSWETVFPMDDETMDVFVEHATELNFFCPLLLPPAAGYRIARDKGLTIQQAEALGIPAPRTRAIPPQDPEALKRLAEELTFPLLLKPRRSSGSRGITVAERAEDLPLAYERLSREHPDPVLQERLPTGVRHDVCLLYDREGMLRASFVQKELRHFPLERGPSTVQESVLRPDLLERADRLMRSLNWRGIAEVEFMLDQRDGEDKLLEINPRFWASLHLAVVCGVDFPWLYYSLAIGRDVEDSFAYPAGVRCRWSLPGDILHFLTNKDRFRLDPSFFRVGNPRLYDDILSREDPLPLLGFILAVLHYLPDREMWRKLFDR